VSERQTGTTIARVDTPKGTEPHGRRRRIPAACLAPTTHFGGSKAGGILREDGARKLTSVSRQTPGPRRNPGGRSRLRPMASERVASVPRERLRPGSRHRGSARSRASARERAKLVAAMLASAPPLVAAWSDECRFRPTPATARSEPFERPASLPPRLVRNGDEGSARTPSGERIGTGSVALASSGMVTLPRNFAARPSRTWDSSASRCGHTLKWRPRAWEAERWRCLHRRRST
jgi:hypothetical protein